jgi:hypothetical protein
MDSESRYEMKVARWRARLGRGIPYGRWLAAGLGIVSIVLAAVLIKRAGSSTAGTPLGWALLALGIIGLLIAFGIAVGAYGD